MMITSLYYFCLKQGEKLVTVSIIHRRKIKIIKDFIHIHFRKLTDKKGEEEKLK